MALIHCPQCGKEISDKASQCVHCGYTMNKDNTIHNKLDSVVNSEDSVREGNILYIADIVVVIVSLVLILLVGNSVDAYELKSVKVIACLTVIAIATMLIYVIHNEFRIGIRKEKIDAMTDTDCLRQMTHDINVIKTIIVISVALSAVLALIWVISLIDL